MSDIVERLRAYPADPMLCGDYSDAMLEAADEIERLRAEVRRQALDYLHLDTQAAMLMDERDKLRAALPTPLSEGALMGVYMEFDRHADKTWPPAEYLLRFAAAVQRAVLASADC